MKILITGTAGFIGYHLTERLIKEDFQVTGLDNINDYYSVDLKYDRLAELGIKREKIADGKITESLHHPNFQFIKTDLENRSKIMELFEEQKFDVVVNLAAQAGVRYSLKDPYRYIESNVKGFLNILEGARHHQINHLIYASSSSVYGANTKKPFATDDNVDHPMSLYAASKKSNELMAHTYSNLFDVPTTGLRFFTVYGPWGRPDMALFLFAEAMLNDEPIDVFNYGEMERDFTYIADIIEGIFKLIPKIPTPDESWNGEHPNPATSFAPYRIFNIGNNSPVKLMDFIQEIENQLGIQAQKKMLPMQPGDVPKTCAYVEDLYRYIDFRPQTTVKEGIRNFIEWYKNYYEVEQGQKAHLLAQQKQESASSLISSE